MKQTNTVNLNKTTYRLTIVYRSNYNKYIVNMINKTTHD